MDTIRYNCSAAWFEGQQAVTNKLKLDSAGHPKNGAVYVDGIDRGSGYYVGDEAPLAYPKANNAAKNPSQHVNHEYYANQQTQGVPMGFNGASYGVLCFPDYNVEAGYRVSRARLFFKLSRMNGTGGLITSSANIKTNGYRVSNPAQHSLAGATPITVNGATAQSMQVLSGDWRSLDVTNVFENTKDRANAIALAFTGTVAGNVLTARSWRLCDAYATAYATYPTGMPYVSAWGYRNFRDKSYNDVSYTPNDPTISVVSGDTPYLEIDWIPTPPAKPTSLSPSNQVVNPRTDIRLAWNATEYQTRFQLRYRVGSGAWTTINRVTKQRYYTIPAGTITAQTGTFEWAVKVWGADPDAVSEEALSVCELGVLPQRPPVLLRPIEDYIKASEAIVFEWAFIANTIEWQASYELWYKIGTGSAITRSGSGQATTLAVNASVSGSAIGVWKMRVKNNFGDWSDWTDEVQFTLVGTPPMPQILAISDEGRPLVTWSASDQQSYRLTVYSDADCVYDTADVIDQTARAARVTKDIYPGQYRFRLSIRNAFGIESPVADLLFTISVSQIPVPEIQTYQGEYFALIIAPSGAEVYRDGELIGIADAGEFHDFGGINGKVHSYSLKVREGNNFSESGSAASRCLFIGDTLAPADNPAEFLPLWYTTEAQGKRDEMLTVENAKLVLEGRAQPYYEFGEHEELSFSRTYCLTAAAASQLQAMVRHRGPLLYRDRAGWNAKVVLTQVSTHEYMSPADKVADLTFVCVGKEALK